MVRSFDGRPVDGAWLTESCAEALRAPTAGNTAGVEMTVATGKLVEAFFTVATDATWRESAPRAEGLMRAGAIVVVSSLPGLYAARYSESDKRDSGLDDVAAWPVPYWHTDAAMATMALLLLVEEAGLDACLWGAFRHEREILDFAECASDARLFASILIGYGDGHDRPSRSLSRDVPSRLDRVRRLGVE
jgi:nitroreductase